MRGIVTIARGGFVVIAGLLATAGSWAQPDLVPTFTNVSVHDPSVVRDGGAYYVFGSHLASASSPDLLHWTQLSTAPTVGNVLVPNPPVEFAEALSWAQTTTFWAPDVIKLADGRYHFYYCACRGDSPLSAMGVAVADTITGPYKNQGLILKSGMNGVSPDGTPYNHAIHPNVVDPSVFFDATGKLWMVYGSFSGGIFILALDPTTGGPNPGQGYGKKLIGGNDARIEGPYILYSPETKYYYLFMTFGGLDAAGGYNIRVGRSRAPDGPYVDAAGNDLTAVKGAAGTLFDDTSIAPYGVKLMGNWQFLHGAAEPGTLSRGYVSPGGTSVSYDAATGQYFLVFHTRFVGRGEYHEVRVHQLYLNQDGWFVAAPQRYAREVLTPTDAALVPGDYKFINHGKAISAAVNSSSVITLQADGSVSGAVSGSWNLSGGHYATLTLDGTVYRGVFAMQWDDDNQRWVQSFSALASTGVAVWGSKAATAAVTPPPGPPAQVTTVAGDATAHIVNLSTRGMVGTGENVLIAGFVVAGAAPKKLLIQCSGLTLSQFGVAGAIGRPHLALTHVVNGVTVTMAENSDWQTAGAELPTLRATTGALPLTPSTDPTHGDAALIVTLPPGQYSVVVSPDAQSGNREGVGLVELYDVTPDDGSHLINISARGRVETGDRQMIVGVAVGGTGNCRLLVRSVGPTLAQFGIAGALSNPVQTVYRQDTHATVAANDDWWYSPQADQVAQLSAGVGAFGLRAYSADAAVLLRVGPGLYSTLITPADGQSGVAMAEIYDANSP